TVETVSPGCALADVLSSSPPQAASARPSTTARPVATAGRRVQEWRSIPKSSHARPPGRGTPPRAGPGRRNLPETPPVVRCFGQFPWGENQGVPDATAAAAGPPLLAAVVAASAAVAATPARLAKIAALAGLLGRLAPDEVAPVVAFLAGEARQGRIG